MKKREIEQTLRDYHWLIREIERLRELLGDAGERITQNYELLGAPRPKGGRSDPVALEAAKRERHWKKLREYEQKVLYIQERIEHVKGHRERTVLDCLLDGMKIVEIARHMGISERQVFRYRDSIVHQMAEMSWLADETGPAGST